LRDVYFVYIEADPFVGYAYPDTRFEDATDLSGWLSGLPHKSVVFAPGLAFLPSIMTALLSQFERVEYVGAETTMSILHHGNSMVFLNDLTTFFPLDITMDHPLAKTWGMYDYWQRYNRTLHNIYGVYASKSPGATALRTLTVTSGGEVKPRGRDQKSLARAATNGGAIHWQSGYYEEAYLYDINGAYVGVMMDNEYPSETFPFRYDPPIYDKWIATVRINYRSHNNFSPLAIRIKKHWLLLHPQEAEGLRVCLTHEDYKTISLYGEVEITEWIEGVEWREGEPLFREWGRLTERMNVNKSAKELLKTTSRALHSKFAQRSYPHSEIVIIDPMDAATNNNILELFPLDDGRLAARVKKGTKPIFRPWLRPDWEALTLSYARAKLYAALDKNTIYTDTDCIISTVPRPDLEIGLSFGQWKLVESGPCAIIGPRAYVIGRKVALSGAALVSREEAAGAIVRIAQSQRPESVSVYDIGGYGKHGLRWYNYPYTRTDGLTAMVKQSPVRREEIVPVRRFLS
jgi:hypothetical protein